MKSFLQDQELPYWFSYPELYLKVFDLNLLNLKPWIILSGDQLRTRFVGLQERYKARDLIPFARREDNDDVACWEKDRGDEVVVIHDFSSPGYEQRIIYENFLLWFRAAIEEMIEFD